MQNFFHPRFLRKFHLYAGCFFTPILVFFILSGSWQVYRLQESQKASGYQPPEIVKVLSRVHIASKVKGWTEKSSAPFKFFCLVMTVFLLITIAIGVYLALQVSRQRWLVWASLLAGILIPVLLLRFP